MDIVYVCAPRARNEELRYSLRSLRNLEHDRVWIAGGAPKWVSGLEVIPVPQRASRYESSTMNLLAAIEHPEVSETFALFNDDFFIMEPVPALPTWHRGPLGPARPQERTHPVGSFHGTLAALRRFLADQGHVAPVSYELHVPMVMTKSGVREVAALGAPWATFCAHKRTIYGNHHRIGGQAHADVKVFGRRSPWPAGEYLSTNDGGFIEGLVGKHIRAMFPDPGPYER